MGKITQFCSKPLMQYLLFFNRIAFIANCCYALAQLNRFADFLPSGEIQSTVIVLGIGIGIWINLAVCALMLGMLLVRSQSLQQVPLWLRLANAGFALLQLALLFLGSL